MHACMSRYKIKDLNICKLIDGRCELIIYQQLERKANMPNFIYSLVPWTLGWKNKRDLKTLFLGSGTFSQHLRVIRNLQWHVEF